MTPEQKNLLQTTWADVAPMADTAAQMFYCRLFELDPAIRELFDGVDLRRQRRKLVAALGMVVGGLDTLEKLVPQIEALGRRHGAYGVTEAHYDTVGSALLWTLEKGLGSSWTSEAEAAWSAAYTLIAGTMRAAADAEDAQLAAPLTTYAA